MSEKCLECSQEKPIIAKSLCADCLARRRRITENYLQSNKESYAVASNWGVRDPTKSAFTPVRWLRKGRAQQADRRVPDYEARRKKLAQLERKAELLAKGCEAKLPTGRCGRKPVVMNIQPPRKNCGLCRRCWKERIRKQNRDAATRHRQLTRIRGFLSYST